MVYRILFNPMSCNGRGKEECSGLNDLLKGEETAWEDITKISDYKEFFNTKVGSDDVIILCGGDGTLNRFINATAELEIKNRIDYYAAGTGNDFLHDIGGEKGKICENVGKYFVNLPKVTVNGETMLFLNGIGYGIDGYCCEVGDRMRAEGKTDINYTSIAIKGVLFHYKPIDADVTIDGKKSSYRKVWLAPAMLGRYYGGGMMPTPDQDRLSPDRKLSICVWNASGRLKTLIVFPSMFKGEHLKHPEMCRAFKGSTINVKFKKPCALQVDGETILGVTEYTAQI